MRLQLVLRKIAILVSLTAGLAITVQASAIDVDKAVLSADRNFANCTKDANYNSDVIICMGAAFEKYNAIAEKLPQNKYDKEVYEYSLKGCSMVEDLAYSWGCSLSAVKYYLHQGDIVDYMSNGKYNTGK